MTLDGFVPPSESTVPGGSKCGQDASASPG